MKIENVKELQKVISVCRRMGVKSIKLGDLELHLGELQPKLGTQHDVANDFPEAKLQVPQYNGAELVTTVAHIKQSTINEQGVKVIADQIATDELTEEQLLYYSARPEASFEKAE